jgi:hypothetical protein
MDYIVSGDTQGSDVDVTKIRFSFSGPGGSDVPMRSPSARSAVRFLSDPNDQDVLDLCTRECCLGLTIKVYYSDELIGNFTIATMGDNWDAYPIISEHPIILMVLYSVVAEQMLKKLTLSRQQ